MFKRFFISFLGTLAGLIVAGFLCFIVIVAIIAAGATSKVKETAELSEKSILHVDLSGSVEDRYQPTPIMDQIYGQTVNCIALNDLVEAISRAKEDKNIEGIYLECNGATAGLAQAQSIMRVLQDFKKSGKWIYAYGDSYTQGNYLLATTADKIFINPQGMLDLHGLQTTSLYFKDFLDKVGVKMQVVKVGTYKSAVEPFLFNDMSAAHREQMQYVLGQYWKNICQSIAANRNVDTTLVNKWADNFAFTLPASDYLKWHMVDSIVYKHQMKDIFEKLTDDDDPNMIGYESYLTKSKQKKQKGAEIAVLYATGDITQSGKSGIVSDKLVPQIMDLIEDDDIDGLILRVNSPGGDAFASEQIWEAFQQFKAKTKKPFYVSMCDYAASGGYYISCGADRIYAEPLTLTGSIGIFGMIPEASELLNNKLGIHTASVTTNGDNTPSIFKAMSPELYGAMQAYVNRGYETFVSRCATGRHKTVDQIKAIAEGRVWDGETALKIGLVDKLGGLDMAIADMAKLINEKDGKGHTGYKITEYPKLKLEWWEEIMRLNTELSDRAVKAELGEYIMYYDTYKSLKELSPLQCRMDYMLVR